MTGDDLIARASNVRNNAMHQQLRLDRWVGVRDRLWILVEPMLRHDARVAIVGGGSCDDVPLARILDRAAIVDLIDFDTGATANAHARLDRSRRSRVRVVEHDVTGGCADRVLRAIRDDGPLPEALPLPYEPLGDGGYDLVIGDMLYTQLLHSGLLALGVHGARQLELMRRYDPPLTTALVQRIQASLAPGGHAIHVHDVACWTKQHEQPIELDTALAEPDEAWAQLRRHDGCDPQLVLERLGIDVMHTAWWQWPFEPRKQFLVRASVARASVAAGTQLEAAFNIASASDRRR